MIEHIKAYGKVLAIIVRKPIVNVEGIRFYTPEDTPLQVGRMYRECGHVVKTHLHKAIPRHSEGNMEVLYIVSGLVRAEIRDEEGKLVTYRHLDSGDIFVQLRGGHGFQFETDSEVIEVKQGPYLPGDKEPL